MSEEIYKVSISGAGLSLERDVPAHVGEQIVVLILSGKVGEAGRSPLPDTDPPPPSGGDDTVSRGDAQGRMSIREYLDDREAKRSPDKITAIGCYLKEHRSRSSFNRSDLEGMFQDAAEAVPKNIPRDLKWATRVGWIAPLTNERGSYYVTAKGMDAVSKKFPKDLIRKTSQATGKNRRSGKKKVEE